MQFRRFFWVIFFTTGVLSASGHIFYLDGVKGNDANNGSTAQSALKTVSRLLAIGIHSGDTIYIAKGSIFREFLNLSAPTLSNITLLDYGTGNRPVFDAADTAANKSFTKVPGSKNLYQVNWKNEFRNYEDVSQYSIWENGWRLKRVASAEACGQTPGSFFAGPPTQPAGTDPIIVHARNSTDITTNNRLYEITRRSMGVQVGDSCHVYNLHTRRNGSNDGSFKSGLSSYIYGVLAEDGVKHNFFMASGMAENCMAWKADNPTGFGGSTLFISYTDSRFADTMNLLYRNCMAIAGMNGIERLQPGIIGLYAHTGSVPYKSLQVKGGIYTHTSNAITAEIRDVVIDSAFFINNIVASSKLTGNLTVKNSFIILAPDNSAAAISEDKRLDSVYFINNKVYMPGDNQSCVKMAAAAPAYCVCWGNTIFSNNKSTSFVVYYNSGGGHVVIRRNLVANRSSGAILTYQSTEPFAKAVIEADSNHYATIPIGGTQTNTSWLGGTNMLKGLAGIKAAGFEPSSSEEPVADLESRITGTYTTTDFFLPATDVLHGRQGSSSTFDGIERFPHRLGDTLGIKPPDNVPETDTVFHFTVKPGPQGNELNWELEGIDSIDHYDVEFGADTMNFSVVTTIPQEQNKESYQYIHEPKVAGNNYYRIVAVSRNHIKSYSKEILAPSTGLYGMTAGPNPVQGLLHIQIMPMEAMPLQLQVFTMEGKNVLQLNRQLTPGRQVIDLNMGILQPGIYNLLARSGTETRVIRIIKQ
jgi:hypothetical protein